MNKRLLTIAAVPAILITLFVFIKYSTAGGVIDHTVKVINDTDYTANIDGLVKSHAAILGS